MPTQDERIRNLQSTVIFHALPPDEILKLLTYFKEEDHPAGALERGNAFNAGGVSHGISRRSVRLPRYGFQPSGRDAARGNRFLHRRRSGIFNPPVKKPRVKRQPQANPRARERKQ